MPGTDDLTESTPVRRLAVARARVDDQASPDEVVGLTAASLAVKRAADLLPLEPSFHPTHTDLLVDNDGDGYTLTVTVQGFARHELAAAALLGTAAAATAMGARVIKDLHVVQSH